VAAAQYYATGRRKTSTARVFLRPGNGAISVNNRTFETFFTTEALRTQIRTPLVLTETADKFDILATVAALPDAPPLEYVEFDSMINVRPAQGNRSRSVEDPVLQARIRDVVDRLVLP